MQYKHHQSSVKINNMDPNINGITEKLTVYMKAQRWEPMKKEEEERFDEV